MGKEVRAKKHLGQHFLIDENIAEKIADTLSLKGYKNVLEIGPGMGVLTKYLVKKDIDIIAMELDTDSVVYLQENYPNKNLQILEADFLKADLTQLFGVDDFAITGNFPYNISTQIVFKTLEWRNRIPEFSGMFQKEVAQRICSKEGSKVYGILSVLTQAFYEAEYLFTVPPSVFNPPPKVESGVLRLQRKADFSLPCDEKMFFNVSKNCISTKAKNPSEQFKKVSTLG
jgi:dimethyladenosine transferase (EC 2.1.1.-)